MELFRKTNITFIGKRRELIAAAISGTLVLLALISIAVKGFNFGIDFTGGVLVELGYQEAAQLDDIRARLAAADFADAAVQNYGNERDVIVRLSLQSASDAEISDRILKTLPGAAMQRIEFVGPQVGEELREDGGLAMLYAIGGILIYVMLRFTWRFSVGTIAATVHDAVITLGFFSISGMDFDLPTLASVLAIIGFSLNDTIVIFDRVREDLRKLRKGTVVDVFNIAINETLSRTFITSGTVFAVVLVLFFFGGDMIHSFSAAMIVGIISGTYSTLYIASPITIWLGVSREDVAVVRKDSGPGAERP